MSKNILNVKDFGAVGDGITDDTYAIQTAIDASVSSGITLSSEFVHKEHFGSFFLPEAGLAAAVKNALDNILGRFPELGKQYKSLLLRDIIIIKGKQISIFAISDEMYRHLPSWHVFKWDEVFKISESIFVEQLGNSVPMVYSEAQLVQFFIDNHGFVNPKLYIIQSTFMGAKDSPSEMILKDSIKFISSSLFDHEKERVLSMKQEKSNPTTIPAEITDSLEKFKRDFPAGSKTAFLMMKFGSTRVHDDIVNSIKETLGSVGITALRADDKEYHDDLYYNILTYIYGCDFGIAIFERIEQEEFNPNVSLEVGVMFGLRKQVCLIKDKTLKTLHTDLIGKLYRTFDPINANETIPSQIEKWLEDKGFMQST